MTLDIEPSDHKNLCDRSPEERLAPRKKRWACLDDNSDTTIPSLRTDRRIKRTQCSIFHSFLKIPTWIIRSWQEQNHQIKIRLKIRQTEEKTARWRNALILISSRLELWREVHPILNNKTCFKLKFYFGSLRPVWSHRPISFSVNQWSYSILMVFVIK